MHVHHNLFIKPDPAAFTRPIFSLQPMHIPSHYQSSLHQPLPCSPPERGSSSVPVSLLHFLHSFYTLSPTLSLLHQRILPHSSTPTPFWRNAGSGKFLHFSFLLPSLPPSLLPPPPHRRRRSSMSQTESGPLLKYLTKRSLTKGPQAICVFTNLADDHALVFV